jgi:hypothetical protein
MIRAFPRRNYIIVAGNTGANDLVVINGGYRNPAIRGMAGLADIGSWYVVDRFTSG